MLDAEEVRGSNPLAPTSKGPGHGPFLLNGSRSNQWLGAQKLTKS